MFTGFADIIFFGIIAVFVFVRLFNVLGNKDYNSPPDNVDNSLKDRQKLNNVVNLNEKIIDAQIVVDEKELSEKYGQKVADAVKEINMYDRSFSVDKFADGASKAFEIILESFSKGDKQTLKRLLDKDIYKKFSDEIDRREKEGKSQETTLISIASTKIKNIELNKKLAKIVVEFISEQVNLLKDKKGNIIEGDPSNVEKITDTWTFSKNISSKDPNWELVETKGAS